VKLRLEKGLLFTSLTVHHRHQSLKLERVLIDTGSVGTLLQTEALESIGVGYEPEDAFHRVRGIGGSEFVFTKRLEWLNVGQLG
jgi:Aspartyl protease